MNLILNPLFQKIAGTIALVAILSGGYYLWHVKPIKDLTEQVEEQEEILDKTKEEVLKSEAESESFEDKWETIKELIWEPTMDSNESIVTPESDTQRNEPQKDINEDVNTDIGEHTITI